MSEDESPSAADWLTRRRRLDSLLRLQAAVTAGDPGQLEAVRLLAEALADPEGEIRELAAVALSDYGPDAQIALPELIAACQDENNVVRRRVLRAIGLIGPIAADDAMPAVLAALEDEDASVVLQAIATLGDFGPLAADALPALLATLWTADARVRAVVGVAMLRIGEATIPFLVQSLSHPALEVRAKAASLLGRFGPSAAEALDLLQDLLNDPDDSVRTQAAAALQSIRSGNRVMNG